MITKVGECKTSSTFIIFYNLVLSILVLLYGITEGIFIGHVKYHR